MDVKEAVRSAKNYAKEVFDGEDIRLEEIWYDDLASEWFVTIGLQRAEPGAGLSQVLTGKTPARLHYKTVRISDSTGKVISVRNHETMPVSPQ
jgi:hypothetical protein